MSTEPPPGGCTATLWSELIYTPDGGMVVVDQPHHAFVAPPTRHAPTGRERGRVVVDRWLATPCPRSSTGGVVVGHHWRVREHTTGRPWAGTVMGAEQVQESAAATLGWVCGRIGTARRGRSLDPAWVWWLWLLGRVQVPACDGVALAQYLTPNTSTSMETHLRRMLCPV